jgi:hypothetical protein
MFQDKELLEQNQLSLFVDQKLRSSYNSAELEEMVQIALLCAMYRRCHQPKISKIVKMLEGDGVAEKWEAMKNIEEPNPDWPSEFVWIGINCYEDQCNSIELQTIELSGVCACVRAHVCVCVCVCMCVLCVVCLCVGDIVIINFRLSNWEHRGSIGMLQIFR